MRKSRAGFAGGLGGRVKEDFDDEEDDDDDWWGKGGIGKER